MLTFSSIANQVSNATFVEKQSERKLTLLKCEFKGPVDKGPLTVCFKDYYGKKQMLHISATGPGKFVARFFTDTMMGYVEMNRYNFNDPSKNAKQIDTLALETPADVRKMIDEFMRKCFEERKALFSPEQVKQALLNSNIMIKGETKPLFNERVIRVNITERHGNEFAEYYIAPDNKCAIRVHVMSPITPVYCQFGLLSTEADGKRHFTRHGQPCEHYYSLGDYDEVKLAVREFRAMYRDFNPDVGPAKRRREDE